MAAKGTLLRMMRGKPRSGRIWRSKGQKKSKLIKVKSLHKSWKVRQKERAEKSSIKQLQIDMTEALAAEKEQKRLRTEEQKKRREENLKKSEVVQAITNSAKIKRMKKKQLRKIEKR